MDRRTMIFTAAAAAIAGSNPALPQATGGSTALSGLFDQFMKENLDLSPITVTGLGLDVGARAPQKSQIDDGSEAGIDRQNGLTASQLARLRAFDRSTLNAGDAINYDVVLYGLRTNDALNSSVHYGPVGGIPYVVSQLSGSYQSMPSFLDDQHTIETRDDAEAYLARLGGFATLMDQEIEVARHDLALGVAPPDFILETALGQMRRLRAPAATQSMLVRSIGKRTGEKHISGDWSRQAAAIVRDKVYPALERQIGLVDGMRKSATHDAGVWRLPNGDGLYAAALVALTTTDLKPAEIHRMGLDLIKEHTARIDELMRPQGLTRGSVGERLREMYKDPKFLDANTDAAKRDLLSDLNHRVQRVRAKLPTYFGTLPKSNVEIKRVPKETEIGAPGGYYNLPSLDGKRPGIYWINLRDTHEVPKWTLPSLTYHESIPGHHLQLSIQQESGLPLIRKVSGFTAYVEGWALYAEQLAVEMGEYDDDPLGHIGQLHDSMLRALRMVVDSGLHSMKWSREQAIRFYSETLGDPVTSATAEVERYCVWPGQACCYMLGKLKFLAVREQARRALGPRFDIRRFHDAMLLSGAVPLDLLDHMSR